MRKEIDKRQKMEAVRLPVKTVGSPYIPQSKGEGTGFHDTKNKPV